MKLSNLPFEKTIREEGKKAGDSFKKTLRKEYHFIVDYLIEAAIVRTLEEHKKNNNNDASTLSVLEYGFNNIETLFSDFVETQRFTNTEDKFKKFYLKGKDHNESN